MPPDEDPPECVVLGAEMLLAWTTSAVVAVGMP
jgi:hypothetical protein